MGETKDNRPTFGAIFRTVGKGDAIKAKADWKEEHETGAPLIAKIYR